MAPGHNSLIFGPVSPFFHRETWMQIDAKRVVYRTSGLDNMHFVVAPTLRPFASAVKDEAELAQEWDIP